METGQPASEPSIEELAASVAKGILSSEGEVVEEKPRDDKGKFTKPQPETAEEVAEPEETEETAEATEEEPAQPEVRKHKLKVKTEAGEDEEVEVDDDELKRGYMKSKDYSRKTAEIARERESLQAKVKEITEPRLRELDEKLQVAEQVIWHTLVPEIQNIDWNKLARENPAEWAAQRQKYDDVTGRLAKIQNERKSLLEAQQKEQSEKFQKQIREAREVLSSDIPNWSDDLYGKILKTGTNYGFKDEEVKAITDPRAIKVLHDAMKYREAVAKPVVEKRVEAKVPKVIKPGTPPEKTGSGDKMKEGMARLQKSGRSEDAVAVAKLILSR